MIPVPQFFKFVVTLVTPVVSVSHPQFFKFFVVESPPPADTVASSSRYRCQPSRRDDMEYLGYVVLWLIMRNKSYKAWRSAVLFGDHVVVGSVVDTTAAGGGVLRDRRDDPGIGSLTALR